MPPKFPGKYFHMTHGRSAQPDMFHEIPVLKVFKKCTCNGEKDLQPRYFLCWSSYSIKHLWADASDMWQELRFK